jgi:hypothetical protein
MKRIVLALALAACTRQTRKPGCEDLVAGAADRAALAALTVADPTLDGYRHALIDNLDRRAAAGAAINQDATDADRAAILRNVKSYCGMKP